jgi:predicted transposase YdaD
MNVFEAMKLEGVLEGEQKGRLEAQKQIAQELIKSGIDESIVARVAHLNKEDIDQIRKALY